MINLKMNHLHFCVEFLDSLYLFFISLTFNMFASSMLKVSSLNPLNTLTKARVL